MGRGFALLSGLAISIVYILSGKIREESNTISFTRLLYSGAALSLLVLALLLDNSLSPASSANMLLLLVLGLVPTILGHSGLYYSIKYSSPTVVASVPIGEPVMASILALLLFAESIPLNTWGGGLLVLIGLYLIMRYHKPLI
jgi:drug/metabolite transporter (DMT)-like permease